MKCIQIGIAGSSSAKRQCWQSVVRKAGLVYFSAFAVLLFVSASAALGSSIWPDTAAPATPDSGPDQAVEVGVKVRSDVAGTITGVRFYKSAGNTGTHTGHLWTNTGAALASATFTGESASGWQQVNFSTPVSIAANTIYVVSYHTSVGHYADDQNYFAIQGVDNAPLHALANTTSVDGVYAYGSSSTFPVSGWRSSNYWVDLVFSAAGSGATLSTSPTSLNFGSVNVGATSAPRTVTMSNTGTGIVTISQATVTGTGFSISSLSLPLTLASGASTSLTTKFSPSAGGSATGTISVLSNASNSPATITLSGTGVMPQLTATPTSVSFGSINVGGTSAPQTVILTNGGAANVTISQATVTGAGFSISGLSVPFTLAAGQSRGFSAIFAPTKAGAVSGSILVVSNASNSSESVALSGTGNGAQLTATPTSTNFANVLVGNSSTLPITLQNTGTSSLTISQANVVGAGFSITGLAVPLALSSGQNTSFSVNFAPKTTGSVKGNISLVSNALNSPTAESLSGTGVKTHSATLSWTASTSTNVSGYNIYRATVSGGPYTELNSSLVTGTSYIDSTPQAGQTYYYVATSVDNNDDESVYSNELKVVVPTP